jgi:hypothetical protein
MLPEWKDLRKSSRKIKLSDENYFDLVDEYVGLKEKFKCESPLETIHLWIDMVFYPIYIVFKLCMLDFSISNILTFVQTYNLWIDWFRLQELEAKFETWKKTVRSLGGPWISSNTLELQPFVYADGMERIRYSKKMAGHPSQKTEKRSPKVQPPVQLQASSQPKSPSVPSEVPLVP